MGPKYRVVEIGASDLPPISPDWVSECMEMVCNDCGSPLLRGLLHYNQIGMAMMAHNEACRPGDPDCGIPAMKPWSWSPVLKALTIGGIVVVYIVLVISIFGAWSSL